MADIGQSTFTSSNGIAEFHRVTSLIWYEYTTTTPGDVRVLAAKPELAKAEN